MKDLSDITTQKLLALRHAFKLCNKDIRFGISSHHCFILVLFLRPYSLGI